MKPILKPIREQVIVLMGATSGIGLETAKLLINKGAQVVIVGRSEEGLDEAAQQVRLNLSEERPTLRVIEDQLITMTADATNFEQVKSVADQVVQRFGRIDTWVNIAAVGEWALFEETSPEEFHRIIEVNLLGQAYGAMAALPYLKQQQGGALIFIASVAGRIPIPYQSAYNASKHGVLGLVDTLRQEVRHTHLPISVTAILPASINTPLFEKARTKIGTEPHPIPPIYNVHMVAQAIAHAAEHPVRELIVGDAGYMMIFMRRLAPNLTSNMIGASGFKTQLSDEPKSGQDPDNLYRHLSGYEETQGEYSKETKPISVLTWLSVHPKARSAVYGGLVLGLGALVGWRIVKARDARRGLIQRLPRMVSQTSQKVSKQAVKQAGKTFNDVGKTLVDLPLISRLPLVRRRTILEKVGIALAEVWGTASQLSFSRRQSLPRRLMRQISSIRLPWDRRPSLVERITLMEQRKAAAARAVRLGGILSDQVNDTRKAAASRAGELTGLVMDRVNDTRSMAQKVTGRVTDSVSEQAQDTNKAVQKLAARTANRADRTYKKAEKAIDRAERARMEAQTATIKAAQHLAHQSKDGIKAVQAKIGKDGEVVVRRQTLIEKLPFGGERRETIVEKAPSKN